MPPLRIEEFNHRPHVLPDATDSTDGIMSAVDKTKLDGYAGASGVIFGTLTLGGVIPAPLAADVARAGNATDSFSVPAGVSKMRLEVFHPNIAALPASAANPILGGVTVIDTTVIATLPIQPDGTFLVTPGNNITVVIIVLNLFSSDLASAAMNVGDWLFPYSRTFF